MIGLDTIAQALTVAPALAIMLPVAFGTLRLMIGGAL